MSIGEPRVSIAPPPLESWPSGLGVEVEWFRGCILVFVWRGVLSSGCCDAVYVEEGLELGGSRERSLNYLFVWPCICQHGEGMARSL